VIPDVYVAIYAAARAGDWPRANELQQQAVAALRLIHAGSSGGSFTASAIGSFKVALREMGVIRTASMTLPLQPLSEAEEDVVRQTMRVAGIQSRPAAAPV
jgi:4-hydroxy-tetrahydrodipicolinate synthase